MSNFVGIKSKNIQINVIINEEKLEVSILERLQSAFAWILHNNITLRVSWLSKQLNRLIIVCHLPSQASERPDLLAQHGI